MTTNARQDLARIAHAVFDRRLTHGRTGNVAVRDRDTILVTPTNVSLGQVDPDALSVIGADGAHLAGPRPTKEAFLHAAVLRTRPDLNAVIHTHSTYSAALSCLDGLDPDSPIPPLTAYFGMRVGSLRLLPYFAPGDPAATPAVEGAAARGHAFLLRNHGPVVGAPDLDAALDALEELEHTAQLFFITAGHRIAPLGETQLAALTPTTHVKGPS